MVIKLLAIYIGISVTDQQPNKAAEQPQCRQRVNRNLESQNHNDRIWQRYIYLRTFTPTHGRFTFKGRGANNTAMDKSTHSSDELSRSNGQLDMGRQRGDPTSRDL